MTGLKQTAEMGVLPIGKHAAVGFADWLKEHLGGRRWVVARRSARIVARYGDDVVLLARSKYAALEAAYVSARPHVCKCEFCGATSQRVARGE